ncbi:MAG: 3'-5' exonuclease [Acidobacteriota bacterium]
MSSGSSPLPSTLIVFDVETTGLEPSDGHALIEIGAVPILDGKVREDCAFHTLIDPDRSIPPESVAVHAISEEMVRGKPRLEVVLPEFLRYCGSHDLVAQNASFDMAFVGAGCEQLELTPPNGVVHDTVQLSKQLFPGARQHGLDAICYRLEIEVGNRHRSIDDVLLTAQAFLIMRERLEQRRPQRN